MPEKIPSTLSREEAFRGPFPGNPIIYFVFFHMDSLYKLGTQNRLNSGGIPFPVHIHIEFGGLFSGNFDIFPWMQIEIKVPPRV